MKYIRIFNKNNNETYLVISIDKARMFYEPIAGIKLSDQNLVDIYASKGIYQNAEIISEIPQDYNGEIIK
jgi:hypothetical protein